MDNPISMLLLLTGGGVFIGMLVATLEAIRLLQAKKNEQDGANVILSVLFGGFIFLCTPVGPPVQRRAGTGHCAECTR